MVTIDTSGSIGSKELNEFGAEIKAIVSETRPAETIVIYCDARVAHVDRFGPHDDLVFKAHVSWALFPIAIFAFGWAMMVPVVTLLVLDLHPDRRGMASSLQMFVGSSANGVVAGVISPLVMHSAVGLAAASVLMMCLGLGAWMFIRKRWPEIGQKVDAL